MKDVFKIVLACVIYFQVVAPLINLAEYIVYMTIVRQLQGQQQNYDTIRGYQYVNR